MGSDTVITRNKETEGMRGPDPCGGHTARLRENVAVFRSVIQKFNKDRIKTTCNKAQLMETREDIMQKSAYNLDQLRGV